MTRHATGLRFRVGAIVLGTGVLFLGLVFFILGSSVRADLVTYQILFSESVKGMVIGSKVNFQGIPVGSVQDIRFQKGKTLVSIAIDREKARVQEVTVARMDRLMVTGQVTVELEGYEESGRVLAPGGMIPPRMSALSEFAQSLPELVVEADGLVKSMRTLMDRLGAAMNADNKAALGRILANLDQSTGVLATQLEPLLVDGVRPALASMEKSFARLEATVGSEDVRGTLAEARAAALRLGKIEDEVLKLVGEVRGVVRGGHRSFGGAMAVVQEAFREIRSLARDLRLAPSSLFFGRGKSSGGR